MKKIEILADYISFDFIPSSWKNCFRNVQKIYQEDWLSQYNFDEILTYYGFDDSFKQRFFSEIASLKKDKKLSQLCFLMYYILFLADEEDYYNIWSWKSSPKIFSKHGSYMMPVVSLLCGYSFHIKNMKKRSFNLEQIDLQKQNVCLACTSDKKRYQIDGIRFSQMIWGSFFMKGKLIQIGRLQYEIRVGNLKKVDQYFSEDLIYIYIHIPRGESLSEEEVDFSFGEVDKFIKKYYPEFQNRKFVYYTESWLLSPELLQILAPSSNIIRFQKKFNIMHYEENVDDFLNFVFNCGFSSVFYQELPEKTSLQRGLKQILLKGERLHLGLGILKKECIIENKNLTL